MKETLDKNSCRVCLIKQENIIGDDRHNYGLPEKQDLLCSDSSRKMFSIHKTMIGNFLVRDLIYNLTQTKITYTDDQPDLICSECLDRLHIANHFRMQFMTSNNLLNDLNNSINNTIKHLQVANNKHTKNNNCQVISADDTLGVSRDDLAQRRTTIDAKIKEIVVKVESIIRAKRREAFICCICSQKFTTEMKLLKHVEVSHCDQVKEPQRYSSQFPITCLACNCRFQDRKELRRHRLENLKQSNLRPYSCAHCTATFTHRDYLTNHLKTHTKRLHFCEYCGLQFTRSDHLKTHITVQHQKVNVKCYVCDLCSASFTLKQNLQVHMRVHSKEKRFKCEHCNKEYAYHCDLKRHVFRHEGTSPYRCEVCHKNFYSKSNLNVHLKAHNGLKSFQCGLCRQTFAQKVSLKNHCKIIHK